MSWILCTSGAAIAKAGYHALETIRVSGAALARWSDEAEGRIEAESRRLWVSNYSGLDTGTKNILADVCSSLIAMNIISYDTTGYLSREADILLNVNDDKVNKGLIILKDFKSNSLQTP